MSKAALRLFASEEIYSIYDYKPVFSMKNNLVKIELYIKGYDMTYHLKRFKLQAIQKKTVDKSLKKVMQSMVKYP